METMLGVAITVVMITTYVAVAITLYRRKIEREYIDIDSMTSGMGLASLKDSAIRSNEQAAKKYTEAEFQEYANAVKALITMGEYETELPEPTMNYLLPLVVDLHRDGYISEAEREIGDGTVRVKVTWRVKAKHESK